ncbi:TPA: hypothetical protein DCE37_22360 [Candidatus Latescibacteria bacterium]|nr:hypothetical protein [Candidatus Latescibacterota bacterium]|tara:strand:- start:1449 stop:2423 length:975 start_codon:yes stop_codon:yes gene_type:complete
MNLLDRDDIESFFAGVVRLERTESGIRPHRHTEKQIQHYETANEMWGVRANCTAGVVLRLFTDSQTVTLSGQVLLGARQYAGFDVAIDGRWIRALRFDTSDETRSFSLEFDTREKREISCVLPQSAIVEFDAIQLDTDATVAPGAKRTRRYLALGDSITQGMDARGPASAYPIQLARMLDADLLNLGVGGHIFDPDALDDDLPYSPDLVTIAYGTNDWSRDLTRTQVADVAKAYLDRLTRTVARDAQIYLLTPLWRTNADEVKPGGNLIVFSGAIAEAAGSVSGVSVIDGTTLVPHREDLFVDGLHPNDEGFLHYAVGLRGVIA